MSASSASVGLAFLFSGALRASSERSLHLERAFLRESALTGELEDERGDARIDIALRIIEHRKVARDGTCIPSCDRSSERLARAHLGNVLRDACEQLTERAWRILGGESCGDDPALCLGRKRGRSVRKERSGGVIARAVYAR